jgi:adenine phosphoribosyltransferase
MPIKSRIRTIPDYPKPGIMFRDITSLLEDAQGFRKVIDELVYPFAGKRIDKVAGIEARGFILGGAVAHQLSVGFVPVRKRGKLPRDTIREAYDLEYGKDEVEIHSDAIAKGENILLIDDLIATGGTAAAAAKLVTRLGGRIAGCSFVIDLPELGGKKRLEDLGYAVYTLVEFEGH